MKTLEEQFLRGSGAVSIRFFLTPSENKSYLPILIIRYTGKYPSGSAGDDDAIYMYAMAKAAVTAFRCWGVIHDFSELQYDWGDKLEVVFGVSADRCDSSPVAIVVGPGCEEAIRTLYHGVGSEQTLDSLGWAFRDLPSAWRFVADRIT